MFVTEMELKMNSKIIGTISVIVIASLAIVFTQTDLFSSSQTDEPQTLSIGDFVIYDVEMTIQLFGNTSDISGTTRLDIIDVTSENITIETTVSGNLEELVSGLVNALGGDNDDTAQSDNAVRTIPKGEPFTASDIEDMQFVGETTIQTVFGDKKVLHYHFENMTNIDNSTNEEIRDIYLDKESGNILLLELSTYSETPFFGVTLTSSVSGKIWISDTNIEWLK